jgi:uncharacterized protein (DUF1501 family)
MNNSTPSLPTTRREFMRLTGSGMGLLAFSAFAPAFLTRAAGANVPAPERDRRILVLVQLGGGNDGLNTIVPFEDDNYYKLRPRLGFQRGTKLYHLNDQIALPPSCLSLSNLFNEGKFTVVQNVGYPNPNRSHFRSTEIWETASDADTYLTSGWLGRYVDNCCDGTDLGSDPAAVHGTTTVPQTFQADKPQNYFGIGGNSRINVRQHVRRDGRAFIPLLDQLAQAPAPAEPAHFLSHTLMDALVTEKRVQQILASYRPGTQYPNFPLAQSLRGVAALVAAGLETRVYFCSQPGYDTHSNQFNTHQNKLNELSESLAAFQHDLEQHGLDKQVLTMTFSEFGRRPYENDALGTDHGTAAPLFLMGTALKTPGGIVGHAPNLNIGPQGDLEFKTDFRQVYSTVLHRWLDTDPVKILGKKYEELTLV